jgi:hypothetical protein
MIPFVRFAPFACFALKYDLDVAFASNWNHR